MTNELEEIIRKVPDGYREATPEEEREILHTGLGLQMWDAKTKQYKAEQESAKLNLKNAVSQLQLAKQKRTNLFSKLGVKDEPGYLLPDGSRIFVLTDPEKKIDRLPEPLAKEKEKASLSPTP